MADGYRVDLSALEATITELRRIEADLDHPQQKAKYDTSLTQRQLGNGFGEATTLYEAHDKMAKSVHAMIAQLQGFVRDFGNNAKTAHQNYSNHERDTAADMQKNF
jgi:hypothetical protein